MMITIYIIPSHKQSRNVESFFLQNNISFCRRNLKKDPLKKEELREILKKSTKGIDEIISTRTPIYKKMNQPIENFYFEELLDYMIEFPQLVRKPIIVDENKIMIGYKQEEIRKFITRKERRIRRKLLLIQSENS